MNDREQQKLADYRDAELLAKRVLGMDVHFFLLLLEFRRLDPEKRLAQGLARGRRKYFLISR